MKKSDFYFDLPEELIAQTPLEQRDHSRLLHLNKTAKVTYKSSKPSIAKVDKKGKVTPVKNGRADITVTIVQNGITYKYFVVFRSTEKGVESNTSYLKVIR